MSKKWIVTLFAVVGIIVVVLLVSRLRLPSQNQKATFNIGFNEWVGFAPFFLAQEKGYFDDLSVSLNFIDLEGDKRAGLYAGRLQMICETIDMFQTSRDTSDYPGKIVFAIDESLGGDGIVATDNVKSIKDLKDKVVVSEPGLPAHFILQYLLHKEGMTLKDVRLQDMTSADAAAAFIAKRADVAGTYEPYLTKALDKRQGAHLLVSTKDLPGLIVDVAIVTDDTLQKRKKDVEAIYRGWCQALHDLENDPDEAVRIMAKAFKLSPEEFNDTRSGLRYINYDENIKRFSNQSEPTYILQTFNMVGQILKENGLTKAVATGKDKVDFSIAIIELQ